MPFALEGHHGTFITSHLTIGLRTVGTSCRAVPVLHRGICSDLRYDHPASHVGKYLERGRGRELGGCDKRAEEEDDLRMGSANHYTRDSGILLLVDDADFPLLSFSVSLFS